MLSKEDLGEGWAGGGGAVGAEMAALVYMPSTSTASWALAAMRAAGARIEQPA